MDELKITLSINEINLVLASLSELPYKTVDSLITKITNEAQQQLSNTKRQVSEVDVESVN